MADVPRQCRSSARWLVVGHKVRACQAGLLAIYTSPLVSLSLSFLSSLFVLSHFPAREVVVVARFSARDAFAGENSGFPDNPSPELVFYTALLASWESEVLTWKKRGGENYTSPDKSLKFGDTVVLFSVVSSFSALYIFQISLKP